jgi:hypothetical protein
MAGRRSGRPSWVGACSIFFLAGCGGGGGSSSPQPQPPPLPAGSLQLTSATFSVAEATATATIGVVREGGTGGAVTVQLTSNGGNATAGQDYAAVSATISFAAGESGTKTATIAITNDDDDEVDETLNLALAGVTGGATYGALTTAVLTIVDDDPPLQTVLYEEDVGGQVDLIAVRENGTRRVPLAFSNEDEAFYGVSPDGRVLFARGGTLYSILADGTGVLTVDDSGQFIGTRGVDRDGRIAGANGRIVIDRRIPHAVEDHHDLVTLYADGTGEVTLAGSDLDEEFMAVTPSGRVVIKRLPPSGGNVDLFAVNADGTQLATLAATADYEEFLDVTASGRVIFRRDIGSQQDIYSVNEDGTGLAALATAPQTERFAGITPAGHVIFTRGNDLHIVNEDGSDPRLLAGGPAIEDLFGVAPSGRIVFASREIGGPNSDLYAIDPDGSGLAPLAATADYEAFDSITPGGRLVYSSSPIVSGATGFYDLHTINLDGTEHVQLSDTPNDDERLQLVTQSGSLIFSRLQFGQSDMLIVPEQGPGSTALALGATAANEFPYALTENGRLLFQRDQGGELELWSIQLDGTDAQQLATGAGSKHIVAVF